MTSGQSKRAFLDSEKGEELRKELQGMVKSPDYNTRAVYSLIDTDGNQFVEKHMNYMSVHPTMDHRQYVMNIKLMTKIKK